MARVADSLTKNPNLKKKISFCWGGGDRVSEYFLRE